MRKTSALGFTLMEVMTVIAIIAVIVGIAIPNYSIFTSNGRLAGASEELMNSLSLAKSEAVKRGRMVTVCNSANPAADTPTCTPAGNEDWRTGWIVYFDNGKAPAYSGDDANILRTTQALGSMDSATASGVTSITFRSTISQGTSPVTIRFCTKGATERQVIVDRLGSISRNQGNTCN